MHTIFDVIDSDGNGVLDIEEFATMADCTLNCWLLYGGHEHLHVTRSS